MQKFSKNMKKIILSIAKDFNFLISLFSWEKAVATFYICRKRQEGSCETRSWRRIWISYSWLKARGSFRDRARHARGEFRSRGWRHHHVGKRQKRYGRHALGGRKTGALRYGCSGIRSRKNLQRIGAACCTYRSEGERWRSTTLFGILMEKIHIVVHGKMGSTMVRSSSWQLPVLL